VFSFGKALWECVREGDCFHHLPNEGVCQEDDGGPVLEGPVEGFACEVEHFLNAAGGKYGDTVVSMAAAFCGGEVVALFGGDVAQARACAHDVDDDGGQAGSGEVGYTLLHEAQAWAGSGGHGSGAACGGAVDHVDGGNFVFSLHGQGTGLWEEADGGLDEVAGGRDGIAEEGPASGGQGAADGGIVALEEGTCHGVSLFVDRVMGWGASADGVLTR